MKENQKEMTATWLREGRLSKGLTQKELSERSNISIRSIQRIENGEIIPRSHTLKTLAGILELSFEEFMKSARKQNITIQENEDIETATSSSLNTPQRIILSIGICFVIIFLAWAFASQSSNFPETTFELLVFATTVLALITGTLFFLWRKKH
jgi:transcriptional regulator with XRE-family HTH domain